MGASENLTITINGKEYVSKEAQKAGKGIENLEKKAKTLGETTKKLKVGAIAFVASLVAIQKVVSKMTGAYGEQEKAELKLEAAIKATGKAAGLSKFEMASFATELSRMTGIADETIIEAQAVMATFTQIGEDVFPSAMEAAADMSAMFGQDLQSSVVQLGKALNDPIAGIGALARVGVSFTSDQKDMIKTMTEAGDVMGAQNIILGEMERQFGGTAEAMGGGWTQSVQKLSNAFGDLAELGGKAIAEFLKPGVDWLTKMAEKAYDAKVEAAALAKYWDEGAQTQDDLEAAYSAPVSKLEEQKRVLAELKAARDEGERTRGNTGARLAERNREITALEKEIQSMQVWVDSLREVEAAKDAVYQAELSAQQLREQVNETIRQIMDENLTAEDRERQKIQERIDLLAKYRNEQEKGSAEYLRVQKIIDDLVKSRDELAKSAKEENKELTLLEQVEKDITAEMERQKEALDAIDKINWQMMEAIKEGDQERLERLQKILDKMREIAGIEEDAADSGSDGGSATYTSPAAGLQDGIESVLAGHLEGLFGMITQMVMEFGAMGYAIAAINELMAGFMAVVGPLVEDVLQPISLFLREIGAMLGTMIQPMLEALAPIIAVVMEALTFLQKSLLIGMAPIIQIVTELLTMLAPVIEGIGVVINGIGVGLLWLYNNVIRHVGNGIMTVFNVVYNAVVAVANGFIAIYNLLVRDSKELGSIAYRDTTAGWAAEISADSLTAMGSAAAVASYDSDYGGAYGGAGGAYGGGTSVQQPSPIYVTLNFNSAVVGAGGIEEVGGFLVDAIQEFSGAGGVVTFLEV